MDYHTGDNNAYFHPCHGGANQKWSYNPETKQLKSDYDGKCLDYNPNNRDLYMYSCHSASNQKFNFPAGFFGDVPEFCWKDSYGRGVGTIPDGCPPGKERIGALCYSSCPSGMYRFGFDCHANCPSGFRDEGLFCRKDAYGRGGGYAFWDTWKCDRDHGAGNCEWWGGMVYPKCAPGYHNSACCICTPNNIDCNSLAWMSEVPDDASCAKQIRIGDPTPMICPSSKTNSGGLCYPPCGAGYTGVGPVCWGNVPSAMVDCGMGAAQNSSTCAQVVSAQVLSVFEFTRKIFKN
jgi:Ricin-type beta-trefoil lectin domain